MTDDAQFIPEKKTEPADKVAMEFGVPMDDLVWRDKKRGIREDVRVKSDFIASSYEHSIALQLFAQAVSKPLPVNDPESHPDYEQIAKECFQRAKDTTPYLLREMGLLPKGDDDGA